MRQKVIEKKNDTYDHICLYDIELHDEWITEKEDSCLPNDFSWMNIHESFTLEEGAPSKKRKRCLCLNYKTCVIKIIINVIILIISYFISLIGASK